MIMKDLPRPDTSRFSRISPELVVLSYLLGSKRAISLGALKTRLKAFVSSQRIEEAVSALVAEHQAIPKKTIELTRKGKDAVEKALGQDAGQGWEKIWHRRLPLLALGLDPDDGETLRKFASADAQKAATIAVSYGLPKEIMASKPGVCAELLWRTLKARLPEVIGNGPFPPIQKLGTVERVVLAGLANVRARNVTEAVDGVAAAALGLQKCNIDTLHRRLIVLAVEQSSGQLASAELRSTTLPAPSAPADGSFVARVKEVAEKLITPPFQGRVAIAQVYDDYGRIHPDAGSLQSFKVRLVEAAKARTLVLGRLDMPEGMSRELRERSETSWGSDEVHFVITAWK
jgi:hypothetical protein